MTDDTAVRRNTSKTKCCRLSDFDDMKCLLGMGYKVDATTVVPYLTQLHVTGLAEGWMDQHMICNFYIWQTCWLPWICI